jgi:segregation and condensation protein A
VSLLGVTQQFLRHIAALETDDPVVVADFSAVASRLLVLKSRSLLPRPAEADEESIGDLAEELIARREVQRAAHHLLLLQLADASTFPRAVEAIHGREQLAPPRLATHAPALLVAALRRRLTVRLPLPVALAVRRITTIGELIERTLRVVGHGRPARFDELVRRCHDASEVRASFLAVLILARRGVIEADQKTLFGPIELRRVELASGQTPIPVVEPDEQAIPA